MLSADVLHRTTFYSLYFGDEDKDHLMRDACERHNNIK
jgi:hypothetical protein